MDLAARSRGHVNAGPAAGSPRYADARLKPAATKRAFIFDLRRYSLPSLF